MLLRKKSSRQAGAADEEEVRSPADAVKEARSAADSVEGAPENKPSATVHQQVETYEDIEALLQTVLLLAALTLSFVVPVLLSVGRDDIAAADKFWANFSGPCHYCLVYAHPDDPEYVVSNELVFLSSISIFMLNACILTGTTLYVSLSYSAARESAASRRRWYAVGKYGILLTYLLFLTGGFMTMWSLSIAVAIVFPSQHTNFATAEKISQHFIMIGSVASLVVAIVVGAVVHLYTTNCNRPTKIVACSTT